MRLLIFMALLLCPVLAHAEGGSQDSGEGDSADSAPSSTGETHSKSKKAVKSEKETDGTTAPNRFEADTVIKSQYKHEGEQLEVDPD